MILRAEDTVYCASCGYEAKTPEEIASYPEGNCPKCGNSWTGSEKRSTMIEVTVPSASGATQ